MQNCQNLRVFFSKLTSLVKIYYSTSVTVFKYVLWFLFAFFMKFSQKYVLQITMNFLQTYVLPITIWKRIMLHFTIFWKLSENLLILCCLIIFGHSWLAIQRWCDNVTLKNCNREAVTKQNQNLMRKKKVYLLLLLFFLVDQFLSIKGLWNSLNVHSP